MSAVILGIGAVCCASVPVPVALGLDQRAQVRPGQEHTVAVGTAVHLGVAADVGQAPRLHLRAASRTGQGLHAPTVAGGRCATGRMRAEGHTVPIGWLVDTACRDLAPDRLRLPRRGAGAAGLGARVRPPRWRLPPRDRGAGEHPGGVRARGGARLRLPRDRRPRDPRRRTARVPRLGAGPGDRPQGRDRPAHLRGGPDRGHRRPRGDPDPGGAVRRLPARPASTSTSSPTARSPRWPTSSTPARRGTGCWSARSPGAGSSGSDGWSSEPGADLGHAGRGGALPLPARAPVSRTC